MTRSLIDCRVKPGNDSGASEGSTSKVALGRLQLPERDAAPGPAGGRYAGLSLRSSAESSFTAWLSCKTSVSRI